MIDNEQGPRRVSHRLHRADGKPDGMLEHPGSPSTRELGSLYVTGAIHPNAMKSVEAAGWRDVPAAGQPAGT